MSIKTEIEGADCNPLIEASKEELERAQRDYTKLRDLNANYRKQNAELQNNYAVLLVKNQDLRSRIAEVEDTNSTLLLHNQELLSRNKDLTTRNSTLLIEKQDLERIVAELQNREVEMRRNTEIQKYGLQERIKEVKRKSQLTSARLRQTEH